MSDREKKPPINLEDVEPEEELRGSMSYVDNGKAKGPKVPGKVVLKDRKPAMGVLMLFIPILVSVVIAYLLVSQYAPSKGTYSQGITNLEATLTATVNQQLATMGAKVDNVINNYASKTDLGSYITRTEASGYLTSGSLSGYATKADLAGLLDLGDLSGYAKGSDLDVYLTKVGANTTYVTKAELAAAVATLKALIGTGQASTVTFVKMGSGSTYAYWVGPAPAGNYTGVELTLVFPMGNLTKVSNASSFIASSMSPPLGETITLIPTSGGGEVYITGVKVVLNSIGTSGFWYMLVPYLDTLGPPTTEVVSLKL